MKTGVRVTRVTSAGGYTDWVATECEPQGKDTYVRVLGFYGSKEEALAEFPGAEVEDGVSGDVG